MKQNSILLIIFILLLLLNQLVLSETKALIIGVGDYQEDAIGNLPTAINDAKKLSSTLLRLGVVSEHNLTLLLNPGYTDMVYTIIEWIESADEEDTLFFYFGGHSEQAQNENDKTDTYLLPSDFRSKVLTRTAYNFRQEWEEELSDKIKAKEAILIFDTCYSGGITRERSLQDLSFKNLGFENIAKDKGANFLFSSQAGQTSKEIPEGRGGWFTYHLLQGLGKGEANYDGDRYITAEELSKYIQERVSASTKNEQTPIRIIGKGDMKIIEDDNLLYEKLKTLIVTKFLSGKIQEKNSKLYIKILEQNPLEDNEHEVLLRRYLKKYYDDLDTIALEGVTEKIMVGEDEAFQDPEILIIEPESSEQSVPQQQEAKPEKPQQLQEPASRQGTNWLTLIPANELAEGVLVYINGKQEGTLDKDGLLIMNLETGTHTIEIDAPTIEQKAFEITFANDWVMVKREIEAQPAKRKIILISDPLMASIQHNGKELKETTPIQLDIEIGQAHTLTLTKDGYKEKTITIKEETKGEPKQIAIQLEANQAPDKPRLLAPTGTEEDIETILKWYCTDAEGDAIAYDVYIGEAGQELEKVTEIQANTSKENSYTLKNLKPNTEYSWQVIAKDEWRETQGTTWQFKTREIITKQLRIKTEPTNAEIYINDSYKGMSPITTELKEGSHIIEARKDGYKTKSETKTIGTQIKDLNRMETLTLTLEKETGSIYIRSNPSGAYIYLNGSYKGTSPKELENLDLGTYSLKLTKDGYKDNSQSTTIEGGKRETINITLESAEYKPSDDAPEQVLVKAGTFQMGNTGGDSEGDSDEKPVHTVKLTYDYYIGKYEVTFNEYDAYCEAMGKSKPNDEDWGRGNRPVINVSWNEAIGYCNWLSESEGIAKAYDSSGNLIDKNGRKTTEITQVEGYRLPTEAEWEYAARGGHKSTSDYKYAGSNSINTVVWYNDNSNSKIHEVGQKTPNELGLYDMSGNVWEWCHDYWGSDYYDKSPRENPVNLNSYSGRVLRGGSWDSRTESCRAASRSYSYPGRSYSSIGLRIARTRD